MSVFDELKKLTRPYDDDEDEMMDDVDFDDVSEPAYARPTAPVNQAPVPEAPINMNVNPTPAPVASVNTMGAMGMNMGMTDPIRTMGNAQNDSAKYRVILVKPEDFDVATTIATHICQGHAVILNCEDTAEAVARRVVDFLSGCAFALEGSIKKAANNVYIITPKDVGVTANEDGQKN